MKKKILIFILTISYLSFLWGQDSLNEEVRLEKMQLENEIQKDSSTVEVDEKNSSSSSIPINNKNIFEIMYNDSKSANRTLIGIFIGALALLGLSVSFLIWILNNQNKRIDKVEVKMNTIDEYG